MEQQKVAVRSIDNVTHDVLRIVTEKPKELAFKPGQATEVSINKPGWEKETRPFTFTCLPADDHLEFTIKTYPSHKGVTNELLALAVDDELLLGEVFGDIAYRGVGVFIAGGAGITPFISIFRDLHSQKKIGNNRLIFANKTRADIILAAEFREWLGDKFINILSDEKVDGYANGLITADFLREHVDGVGMVYVCGPPPMMKAIEKHLATLGIPDKSIVKETF